MDYNVYLSPSLIRELPQSNEKALSLLALRKLWHTIFDITPKTAALSSNATDLINDFLMFANKGGLSMDWTLHFHLLDWLYRHSKYKTTLALPHILELMTASAVSWVKDIISYPTARGILLASSYDEKIAIGTWRVSSLTERLRIIRYNIPPSYFPSNTSYAISYEQNVWGKLKWIKLEK